MLFLNTENSRPHESFPKLNESNVYRALREDFEINLEELDSLKDIINMYSYELAGEPATDAFYFIKDAIFWRNFEFIIPSDGDLINAAISTLLKVRKKFSGLANTATTVQIDISDTYDDEFVANILNLSVVDTTFKLKRVTMNAYEDVVKVSPTSRMLPDYRYKFLLKKHKVFKMVSENTLTSYLYIDYSASMFSQQRLLKVLYSSVVFDNNTEYSLHVYSVTAYGVTLKGIATTKEELKSLLFLEAIFEVGKLDYDKVITHSNSHRYLSTFITDGDDFDVKEFTNKTNKFNLISISDGEIIKT